MRCLTIAHGLLQGVNGKSPVRANKLVALALSVPIYCAFQLCFQIVFLMSQRRILLLYGRDKGVETNERLLKLHQLGVALCRVGRGRDALRQIDEARSELQKLAVVRDYLKAHGDLEWARGQLDLAREDAADMAARHYPSRPIGRARARGRYEVNEENNVNDLP